MAHILAGLDPQEYDRVYSDRQLFRRMLIYFRPQVARIALVVGIILCDAVLGALLPILISRGIDSLGTTFTAELLIALVAGLFLVSVVTWICDLLQKWIGASLIGDIIQNIRQDVFNSVMGHDMSFFDTRSTGEVVSRIVSDTSAFGTNMSTTINVVSQFLLVAILTIALFVTDAALALVVVLLAGILIGVTLGFRRLARRLALLQQRSRARLNTVIEETISGIAIAKNFRREQTFYSDLMASNLQWYNAAFRMNTVYTSIFPLLIMCTGLGSVAIVLFGGRALHSGTLSVGQWYLFLQCVLLFWVPLTSVASFWSQFQLGMAAGERVFALMDVESQVIQTEQQHVTSVVGQVEFQDVILQYTNRETVLKRFSLTIQAGETVALVGHTGAGKTSVTRLIARLYEFQGGVIRIDGRDIRTLDLAEYQQHIGIIPQMPFLFSGTVAENIRYARPQASEEEVMIAACKIARGEWIAQLSQGLHTVVGERGQNLSTGQRQFVALARVVLQNASIVILDEATSSIDPITEAQIQEGLDDVLRERTALVIAHRLTTVRNADRIVVMEKGSILEQGTHDELLQQGGYYADLYRLYFQYQLPVYEVSHVQP